MSPPQRRYLLLDQGVGAAVVNFLINAPIAWLSFHDATTVPLWGRQSIAGDTLGTAFVLPFLTTLIATRIVRRDVRRGRVPALAWGASRPGGLPTRLGARGAVFGALALAVVGVPAVAILGALGVAAMTLRDFIWFKALFAAALGAVVTPVIARAALADPTPR